MKDPNGQVDKCHGRWSLLSSKTARVGKPTPEWSAWHGRWSCLDGMGQVKQVQRPSEMGSHGCCTSQFLVYCGVGSATDERKQGTWALLVSAPSILSYAICNGRVLWHATGIAPVCPQMCNKPKR